ncbi:UNKNOWN [Stylonychia lemnae]|uniref:Transmembrane protein n=1 Tax=Stylonychia lemnae TaxID=5949 RepID=A0A078AFI6_STYLE|nr:UNKNOWN [Stylonychia lemnae]|eukprot:CDW80960.1 UNKNOWN [Stylonychia lemnae]
MKAPLFIFKVKYQTRKNQLQEFQIQLSCRISQSKKVQYLNKYRDNQAQYGSNIASYPYKIKIFQEQNFDFNQLVSGKKLPLFLKAGLYDFDDQLYILDDQTFASLRTDDLNMSLSGKLKVQSQGGVFNFEEIQIFGRPQYESSILIEAQFKDNYNRLTSIAYQINIQFRECYIGEVLENNQCIKCGVGTFSFNIDDRKCFQCLSNAVCFGGNQMQLKKGYWRSNPNSTIIYKCFDENACKGGLNVQDQCNEGYEGKIWYFQALMICKDFELKWPEKVSESLSYISIFSTSQKNALSFDCIFLFLGFHRSKAFFLKILIFGILPIILSAIGAIIWLFIWVFKRRVSNFQVIGKIKITSFVIILLLYPTVTTMMFQMFQCFKYEDGKSYLLYNMEVECWGNEHFQMSAFIGAPFIIIWSLLFPTYIVLKLKKIKYDFSNDSNLKEFGIFYIGLNDQAYEWEIIIVNFKKFLFILASTFIPQQITVYKTMTLICGMFYMSEEVQQNENLLLFFFIVITSYNGGFLFYWTFTLATSMIRYHANLFNRFHGIKIFKSKIDDYETNLQKYKARDSIQMLSKLFQNKSDQQICIDQNKISFDSQKQPQTSTKNKSSLIINPKYGIKQQSLDQLNKKTSRISRRISIQDQLTKEKNETQSKKQRKKRSNLDNKNSLSAQFQKNQITGQIFK